MRHLSFVFRVRFYKKYKLADVQLNVYARFKRYLMVNNGFFKMEGGLCPQTRSPLPHAHTHTSHTHQNKVAVPECTDSTAHMSW